MLRIHQTKSAAAAKAYYQSGLATEGYYSKEGAGHWFGDGARRLGLHGEVRQADFERLCDNVRPDNGKRLNPRKDRDRRVGYDCTFAAPKSVSLMLEVLGDQRILAVFKDAVRSTMALIEKEVMVRVRRGGVVDVRKSAGIIYAEFVHHTTRPVALPGEEVATVDPALHCHCYTLNSCFDPVEEIFKALDLSGVKRDAPYFEAVFHSNLALGLARLGYGIEPKKFGFEIRGVGEENIRLFSRRTAEIEALADRLGVASDADAKAQLGARSRKAKIVGADHGEVVKEWRSRIKRSALSYDRHVPGNPRSNAKSGAEFAIRSCFERCSVLPYRKIVTEALKAGFGSAGLDQVLVELGNNPELLTGDVNGRSYCTTSEIVREEREVLKFLQSTHGTCFPFEENPGEIEGLDQDQLSAVQALLRSRDRLFLIEGKAGTGKTSLMKEAISRIEKSTGKSVLTLAPTSQASHVVLRAEGFSSETIQQFLASSRLQQSVAGATVWIDEAGLLSIKEMRRLCAIAKDMDTRIVCTGDAFQHHSVERGDAFRMILESGLAESRQTRTVYRQRNSRHREAVGLISNGDVEAGFSILEEMGAIKEATDFSNQIRSVASEYLESIKRGQTALVVSPTHFEGRLVSSEIRRQLKTEGILPDEDFRSVVHRNRNLTAAQRADSRFVDAGDIVKFHQNARGGFRKGSVWTVIGWQDGKIEVAANNSKEKRLLHCSASHHFQLFRPEAIDLGMGDKVRLTTNVRSVDGVRMFNGSVFSITGWDRSGNLILDGRYRLAADSGVIDYGYVTTSYASQGRTVGKVIISQNSVSAPASSDAQFYVCVSRSRDEVSIWTDNKEMLLESVMRSDRRLLASEVGIAAADLRQLEDIQPDNAWEQPEEQLLTI